MIARDPRTTWDYVLVSDRSLPKEERTVFHLRHLTAADEHATLDAVHVDPSVPGELVIRNTGSRALAILRIGLAGWDNMKDAKGNQVAFEGAKSGVPTETDLMRFSLRDRMELSRAIENEVSFTEEELGKSEPLST